MVLVPLVLVVLLAVVPLAMPLVVVLRVVMMVGVAVVVRLLVALELLGDLLLAVLDDLLADLVLLAVRVGAGALAALGVVDGAELPLVVLVLGAAAVAVTVVAAVAAVLALAVEVLPGVDAEEVYEGTHDVAGAVGQGGRKGVGAVLVVDEADEELAVSESANGASILRERGEVGGGGEEGSYEVVEEELVGQAADLVDVAVVALAQAQEGVAEGLDGEDVVRLPDAAVLGDQTVQVDPEALNIRRNKLVMPFSFLVHLYVVYPEGKGRWGREERKVMEVSVAYNGTPKLVGDGGREAGDGLLRLDDAGDEVGKGPLLVGREVRLGPEEGVVAVAVAGVVRVVRVVRGVQAPASVAGRRRQVAVVVGARGGRAVRVAEAAESGVGVGVGRGGWAGDGVGDDGAAAG